MNDFFSFLIVHCFIGYLNYAILKRISQLADDISIQRQFELYEDKCIALFKAASLKDIMRMFDQHSDLKPLTPIGLPHIVFELEEQWLMKHFFTRATSMAEFPWFDMCFFCGLKEICVHLIYATRPSAVPAILKDFRDPFVLKKLEYIGVTVVEVMIRKLFQYFNKECNCNHLCSSSGEVSNESMIILATVPTSSLVCTLIFIVYII